MNVNNSFMNLTDEGLASRLLSSLLPVTAYIEGSPVPAAPQAPTGQMSKAGRSASDPSENFSDNEAGQPATVRA